MVDRLDLAALQVGVRMPSFEAEITSERIGPLPWGDAVATVDRPAGTLALSLANLHPAEPLECGS